MRDIEKAIEIEKFYLDKKLKGEHPFHLIDKIIECGFESLEEYFECKKAHLFKQLRFEIIEKSPAECLTEGWRLVNDKVTAVFFMEPDETTVFVNCTKPYNKEFCIENSITVYELPTVGGTIVSGKGDLAIDFCIPDNIGINTDFMLKSIKKILSKYVTGIEIIDNDILVNNKKVCGITFYRANGMILFAIHFTFTDNLELIKKICHVDGASVKVPYHIEGLNKITLKNEVIKWVDGM